MVAEPALPAPTVAHEIPELVVHVHPVCVVTVRFAEPAVALNVNDVADSVKLHGGCAFWVTVTGMPATVTVPVRSAPVLGLTEMVAVPVPVLPAVTVIQAAPELVLHPHVASVDTVRDAEAAGALKVTALDESV
jgi:hypothetical protein